MVSLAAQHLEHANRIIGILRLSENDSLTLLIVLFIGSRSNHYGIRCKNEQIIGGGFA